MKKILKAALIFGSCAVMAQSGKIEKQIDRLGNMLDKGFVDTLTFNESQKVESHLAAAIKIIRDANFDTNYSYNIGVYLNRKQYNFKGVGLKAIQKQCVAQVSLRNDLHSMYISINNAAALHKKFNTPVPASNNKAICKKLVNFIGFDQPIEGVKAQINGQVVFTSKRARRLGNASPYSNKSLPIRANSAGDAFFYCMKLSHIIPNSFVKGVLQVRRTIEYPRGYYEVPEFANTKLGTSLPNQPTPAEKFKRNIKVCQIISQSLGVHFD